MPGSVQFTRITVVCSTTAGNYYKRRSSSHNPIRDTVQISSKAREKAREFLLELKGESAGENTLTSSQQENELDIFELPASATRDEIRNAYHTAMKKYHPDNFAGLSQEFVNLATEKSKQINLAYQRLNGGM